MFKIVQYNIYFGFFDKVSINGRINIFVNVLIVLMLM